MSEGIGASLHNWIPHKLFFEQAQANCNWLYTGEERFTQPFFEETILKCRQLPYNSKLFKCMSSIDVLPEWSGHIGSVEPAAFIFHVSRCGSTLATQLLALDTSNIVLSEVPFFDELLRWGRTLPAGSEPGAMIKAAVKFYGAKKDDANRRLFIKTDSWHIFFRRQLRQLFPATPFILLYRKPDEVLSSQRKQRGIHAVPGLIEPELFGFNRDEVSGIGLDEYMAKVLEKYFEAFNETIAEDPFSFLLNYNEGPVKMIEKIAGIVKMQISDTIIERIKERSVYHAKHPQRVFSEPATGAPIPVYLEKAYGLYEAIEKKRTLNG